LQGKSMRTIARARVCVSESTYFLNHTTSYSSALAKLPVKQMRTSRRQVGRNMDVVRM